MIRTGITFLFVCLINTVLAADPSSDTGAQAKGKHEKDRVVFGLGGFKIKQMSDADYQTHQDKKEARYREAVKRDLADGINEDVRANEVWLSKKVGGLNLGQALDSVTNLFGAPHLIRVISMSGKLRTTQNIESLAQVSPGSEFEISYWPRVGVPFDGRNGQGYKVLFLQFDSEQKLKYWSMEQPLLPTGMTGSQAFAMKAYFYGKTEKSGPPPKGYDF